MVRKRILSAGLSFLLVCLASPVQGAGPVAGKIVSVAGTALLRADGGAGSTALIKPGDTLHQDDVINTSSDGKLKILLGDMSVIDVGPSALFKVAEYKANGGRNREVSLNMPYGNMRAAITQPLQGKGHFRLKTPTATMGVRGTEFAVQAPLGDPKVATGVATPASAASSAAVAAVKTQITVIQGKVDVAQAAPATKKGGGRAPASLAPKTVSLTAGTQLTTSADAPATAPVKLTEAQVSTVVSETKVADNTFQKAIVIDAPGSDGGSGSATMAALSVAVNSSLTAQGGDLPTVPPQTTSFNARGVVLPSGLKNVRVLITQ